MRDKAIEVIWESKLDGRYDCIVYRGNSVDGLLVIYDLERDNELIFQEPVRISFEALFGVDTGDMLYWESICMGFIDNDYRPPGEAGE